MSNPYNYPFIQKDNTMYLSTICTFPFTKPNRISPLSLPSLDRVLSSRKIFQELPRRYWFLSNLTILISSSLLTLNPFLIDTNIYKRHQIPSMLMILMEQNQNAHSSGQEELLILSVPSICFLLPHKLSWIPAANLFVTLWKFKTLTLKEVIL